MPLFAGFAYGVDYFGQIGCWPSMGRTMPMPDLLRLLAAGCPKLDSHSITDRCDVHCPDLVGLFLAAVALGASGAAVKAISISIGETRTSQT